MKYQIVLLSLIASLGGCGQRGASNGNIQEEKPGTAVTLTHAASGKIEKEIILSATTAYQNKSVVGAQIPAFITEVLVQPGSRVKARETLLKTGQTDMLRHFGKDTCNAKYVCPTDLLMEHDRWRHCRDMEIIRKRREEQRQRAIEDERKFKELKSRFFLFSESVILSNIAYVGFLWLKNKSKSDVG